MDGNGTLSVIGDFPNFMVQTSSITVFSRPVLLRTSHAVVSADGGAADLPYVLNFGMGIASPTPDITMYNQPEKFPLVVPMVPYQRSSSSTYFRGTGHSKAMRRIGRGESVTVENTNYQGASVFWTWNAVLRLLIEVD